MRKFLSVFLLLISFQGNALECQEPLVCTQKASEVCAEQSLKLFGEDECVECTCPIDADGRQGRAVNYNGQKYCCHAMYTYDSVDNIYNNISPHICGCPDTPDGTKAELKENEDGGQECCWGLRPYLMDGYSPEDYPSRCLTCPKGQIGTEEGCCPKEKYYFWGKDLCCKSGTVVEERMCCENEVPVCKPEDGILINIGKQCKCGCIRNEDCNQNHKDGEMLRYCQEDQTCSKGLSFSIDNISAEVHDFAGGALTEEKVKALVQKIRSDILASSGNDKVKIIFDGMMSSDGNIDGKNGYVKYNDTIEIHINSGTCTESDETTISCEAVIVHENIHRVDNLKQPDWFTARKKVTTLYQGILTEIRAQAVGSVKHVRSVLETCYRYANGDVWSVCAPFAPDFSKEQCQKCMDAFVSFDATNPYASKYLDYSYAKKYYSDPSWAQYDNCQGLQVQLEEDFTNSDYAERGYFSKMREAASIMLNQVSPFIKKALSQVESASSKDMGLFGIVSRTGFLWNTNQSPPLVSDIANLYSENATLCMSPERFVNHPKIKLGFESEKNINEFEKAYEFVSSNPDCVGSTAYLNQSCVDKLDCIWDEWRDGCWPAEELASHVGETASYTIN